MLDKYYYSEDALFVAKDLIGKLLCRKYEDGSVVKYRITETECYMGSDTASHGRFGRTKRSSIMFGSGGYSYVYMIYGMYFMLNIVTGKVDEPEAVLIRGVEGIDGPGKLCKKLDIDFSLNKLDLTIGDKLWIESDNYICEHYSTPRIGIDYADSYYKNIEWRFIMK